MFVARDYYTLFDTPNAYQFSRQDPLLNSDPSGLVTENSATGGRIFVNNTDSVAYVWYTDGNGPKTITPVEPGKQVQLADYDLVLACCGDNCGIFRPSPFSIRDSYVVGCHTGDPFGWPMKPVYSCRGAIFDFIIRFGAWSREMICDLCNANTNSASPALCGQCCDITIDKDGFPHHSPPPPKPPKRKRPPPPAITPAIPAVPFYASSRFH